MADKRPAPRAFRLNESEQQLLAQLKQKLEPALSVDSEADVIRWGMAALAGLVHDGLDGWTQTLADGRRTIDLRDPRGRTLMLVERPDGSFYPGSVGGPAFWMSEGPPREPGE